VLVDMIEAYLNKRHIKPLKIHARYVSFLGKNCSIILWYDGRCQVYRGTARNIIAYFRFNERQLDKYIVKGDK